MFQKFLERRVRKYQRLQGMGMDESLATEVRAVVPLLPPTGAVVLDVGANKGLWTRELLTQAKNQVAEIHAFEPSRHNHAAIEAIGDHRVRLVKTALGETEGTVTLFSDKPGSGMASLTRRDLGHHHIEMSLEEAVGVTTLDRYVEQNGIVRIDFAKLDIEGHELSVLNGAKNSLSSGVLRNLAFEFGGTNIDTRTFFRDFYQMLVPLGFQLFRINPYRRPTLVRAYSEGLEVFTTTNYLAVRQDQPLMER